MSDIINKYFNKILGNKEDYELFISKKIKDVNNTLEENGVLDKDCFISEIKKSEYDAFIMAKKNSDDQLNSLNIYNIIKNYKDNGIQKNNINIKIKGQSINLQFEIPSGSNIIINIGVNNTFREAVNLLCQKLNISISDIKKIWNFYMISRN